MGGKPFARHQVISDRLAVKRWAAPLEGYFAFRLHQISPYPPGAPDPTVFSFFLAGAVLSIPAFW